MGWCSGSGQRSRQSVRSRKPAVRSSQRTRGKVDRRDVLRWDHVSHASTRRPEACAAALGDRMKRHQAHTAILPRSVTVTISAAAKCRVAILAARLFGCGRAVMETAPALRYQQVLGWANKNTALLLIMGPGDGMHICNTLDTDPCRQGNQLCVMTRLARLGPATHVFAARKTSLPPTQTSPHSTRTPAPAPRSAPDPPPPSLAARTGRRRRSLPHAPAA